MQCFTSNGRTFASKNAASFAGVSAAAGEGEATRAAMHSELTTEGILRCAFMSASRLGGKLGKALALFAKDGGG